MITSRGQNSDLFQFMTKFVSHCFGKLITKSATDNKLFFNEVSQAPFIQSRAVLTVVVSDHAADVMEGDFRRNVVAAIIQHPDLIVFDQICPLVVHISD